MQEWERLSISQGPEVKTGFLSEAHIPHQCPVACAVRDHCNSMDQVLQEVKTNYHNCTIWLKFPESPQPFLHCASKTCLLRPAKWKLLLRLKIYIKEKLPWCPLSLPFADSLWECRGGTEPFPTALVSIAHLWRGCLRLIPPWPSPPRAGQWIPTYRCLSTLQSYSRTLATLPVFPTGVCVCEIPSPSWLSQWHLLVLANHATCALRLLPETGLIVFMHFP